jgi:muramoyltetrapeptide carboxypeptidase
MGFDRRKFMGTIAGLALLRSRYANAQIDNSVHQSLLNIAEGNYVEPIILPRAIYPGSTIAITAPASATSPGEISSCVNYLKKNKCKVIIGDTVTKWKTSNRYFSAEDEERAEEFMHFIKSDAIDAVICARGGYGVMRILPLLDFGIIRDKAKPVIGFSDITALVNAIFLKSRIVSFHGPVAVVNFSGLTSYSFNQTLFRDKAKSHEKNTQNIVINYQGASVLNPGVVTGKLIGGNLSMLTATLGTPYEIDTKDSILFIEEVFEEPYKIDRMLTQLLLAGKFTECRGIILGKFKNLDLKKNFFPGYQFTVRQILDQLVKTLNKPTLMGIPLGHGDEIITMPIGIYAELDATKKIIKLLEQPVTI